MEIFADTVMSGINSGCKIGLLKNFGPKFLGQLSGKGVKLNLNQLSGAISSYSFLAHEGFSSYLS
jgi:hypothetical protein